MISVNEYTRLKQAVEEKQKEAQRAAGAFDQALKQLKAEFKVDNVDDAKALLTQLEEEEEKAEKAFERKFTEFKEQWKKVNDATS